MDEDSLGTEVGLGPREALCYMGTHIALPQKGAGVAHVYCGQTARWIKMPHGTEIWLAPDHIVLDGDPAPPSKWAQPPIFGPCLLWPNGWMDQDAT